MHGRKKEILIKGGVNISPIAVENALLEAHPELSAAYVVGTQHPRWGEDVCATIILKSDCADSPQQLAERITQRGQNGEIPGLSTYEAPARVIPISHADLPLTSTGKVQRSKLRETVQNWTDQGTA